MKEIQLKLAQYSNGRDNDKLCATSTYLYVSSRYTHCVLTYTLSGEYVYRTGGRGAKVGKLEGPLLGHLDSSDKLLVCDFFNHRLQVFDTQNREWSKLSVEKRVERPVCAWMGDKHLWVGTGFGRNQLLKFEVV